MRRRRLPRARAACPRTSSRAAYQPGSFITTSARKSTAGSHSASSSRSPALAAAIAAGTASVIRQPGQVSSGPRTQASASTSVRPRPRPGPRRPRSASRRSDRAGGSPRRSPAPPRALHRAAPRPRAGRRGRARPLPDAATPATPPPRAGQRPGQVGGGPQVRLRVVEVAGEQLRLAAQGDRIRPTAGRSDPDRLGLERVRERDHIRVGPVAVEQPLADAQVSVEDVDRKFGQRGGVKQVVPDAGPQLAPGVRGGGLRPGGDHQRCAVPGLAAPAGGPPPPSRSRCPARRTPAPRRPPTPAPPPSGRARSTGAMPSSVFSPPGGSPRLTCASACLARISSAAGYPAASAAAA